METIISVLLKHHFRLKSNLLNSQLVSRICIYFTQISKELYE